MPTLQYNSLDRMKLFHLFEKKNESLAPPHIFRRRVLLFITLAAGITLVWVLIGTIGFYLTSELDWLDAFYNAAMIASEMGPVFSLTTPMAKIFAAGYALISGLVFIVVFGVALAPLVHRFFHHFHLEESNDVTGE